MTSIEALWSVTFQLGEAGQGGGVLVFETGRLFGGDTSFAYTGHFTLSGDDLSAEVQAIRHTFVDDIIDLWETGDDSFALTVAGRRVGDDLIEVRLTRNGTSIPATLKRIVALP
ncbi:MAG: hypothetical protein ACK5SX_08205 [Sandaracinobacter sp.]